MNGLLLDTHAWIWYAEGIAQRLPANAVAQIEAMRRQSRLFISTVSIWEIGMLQNKRKLTLSAAINVWVERATALPGLRLLPLDVESALESTQLPGPIHGDPADRFLIAIARVKGLHLMTADKKIIEYGREGYLNVFELGGAKENTLP
ncbi:type II toxin-antitoxin system VapC family toxin [Methylocaldum sp.]|uniref:type II toxin-antitoxin system VapC family toxin n=1 Tax=Methylocaldum sp. TaxID=1969727 RepID=UPI002D2E456F|nr:type II toxin-antitoxin system VapC family toxin [Methylocaldum sp.]HYE36744.1 type II toxin-antitoxin system VapC family toxin [Methylocaldum sp.]